LPNEEEEIHAIGLSGTDAKIGRKREARMCTVGCLMFGIRNLRPEDVAGRDVIEVGACEVLGSLRPIVESWGPGSYLGVDIVSGNGVDEICDAEDLVERYGPERFDVVISTEMIEHTRH
jgi:hypothetical protein